MKGDLCLTVVFSVVLEVSSTIEGVSIVSESGNASREKLLL